MQKKIDLLATKLATIKKVDVKKVDAAMAKAVYTLPRLKNYFTKLEKSFKLLVNKQNVLLAIVDYFLKNENEDAADVCYTMKKQFGKTIADDKIIEVLNDKSFKVQKATHAKREAKDYDFNI